MNIQKCEWSYLKYLHNCKISSIAQNVYTVYHIHIWYLTVHWFFISQQLLDVYRYEFICYIKRGQLLKLVWLCSQVFYSLKILWALPINRTLIFYCKPNTLFQANKPYNTYLSLYSRRSVIKLFEHFCRKNYLILFHLQQILPWILLYLCHFIRNTLYSSSVFTSVWHYVSHEIMESTLIAFDSWIENKTWLEVAPKHTFCILLTCIKLSLLGIQMANIIAIDKFSKCIFFLDASRYYWYIPEITGCYCCV